MPNERQCPRLLQRSTSCAEGKPVLRDPPVRARPGPFEKSGGHRGGRRQPRINAEIRSACRRRSIWIFRGLVGWPCGPRLKISHRLFAADSAGQAQARKAAGTALPRKRAAYFLWRTGLWEIYL